ncbi:MAG TPA: ASPIC/UnbV domain-containing protein [Anaerolineae bacterium]
MAVGDTNNDGFLDVVITHGLAAYGLLPGPHELLQNGGNANHWLQIRLVGQQSNRLGIGARVEIRLPDGHFQMREMNGGVHNYAQDEMIVSFGLANQTIVSQLTITWPSGTVQHLTNVASNQRLTIAETGETGYKLHLPLILNNKQATATD